MNKKTIIRTFEKIALYMELLGENHFKVAAFRKAASILELDTRSLAEMDDILSLKGIGKGTGAVITDLMEKGTSDVLTELEEKVPKGLIPLLNIPGLGGKKIAKLREALNIDSIESLQAACERQEVSKIPGFGKKTEENILREIEILSSRSGKTPIWQVTKIVDIVQAELQLIDEIQKFQVAGSYRRREEESSDVDWILVTDEPQIVREKIMAALPIEKVIAAGDAKLSISLDTEHPIDADFRFVTEDQFATALHHFTGSAAHNIRMRQLAKNRKQKISEYGVEDETGHVQTFTSEKEFFAHFDLPFIPPSIRKDGTELDRASEISTLVTPELIRSDLHMHTTWSDGGHSIEEMVQACRAKGYSHMVITDHSHYLKVANGLTPERLVKQIEEIREVNAKYDDIEVFCGTEMDILPDGTLDFDDEILEQLDFVIASIHSSFNQPQEQIMERLHAACQNPHVHMIAHPTGRIIGQREGYNPDIEQLIKWASEYGKILEVNASPYRLDLRTEHVIQAMEAGVNIAINTDAHAIEQLDIMPIGVEYAQKAWLPAEQVVNTWTLETFIEKVIRR
ncbi:MULTISPECIES: DNA polymerase/3'-5' exonuclease PolX [unclassified Sporosarcina]|uniref:DNA polymerase/3'-5' exonuclease PolX n=1 Tax=unclassified Sporosarcina TaxID=2647733 RepID=UPI000C16B787|nr:MULTISPECIES: DNA polymerase/3'-5' exonuclease PolX [unclassified Sporosarcina]PID07229.1 DNA polymerase/3'-5' exonuclease PolX [Sporosarcina sp. P30]PID10425.1 DNA polymerase/3'-5' exonuclease PolX [Sporosarcina sp. P31]PID13010.1 DNA polymerase/3'-5' exonuclease PolX [Sporosarcina sp. P32b]